MRLVDHIDDEIEPFTLLRSQVDLVRGRIELRRGDESLLGERDVALVQGEGVGVDRALRLGALARRLPLLGTRPCEEAVAGLSRGLPRRINLLADKGMMAAAVEHRFEVRSREIATAAKEIKLERARAEKASSRQITVAAGLGFAGGIVATLAFVLAALHFGWVEVHDHAITSAPADTPSSEQSAAPVSHFSR